MVEKKAAPDSASLPLRSSRHGVLEASAGTGKTYTIVEQVKALLCHEGASIDSILVLTFTEKAAAELRDRIAAGLRAAAAAARAHDPQGADGRALTTALQDYASASISTLHGFCNRVLSEFGFESDLPFSHQIVDDTPVMRDCLREIQREQWPQWYGAELPEVLAASGYPAAQWAKSNWENTLLRLVRMFQPRAGDRLLPEQTAVLGPRAALAAVVPRLAQLFREEIRADSTAEHARFQAWAQALAEEAKVHGNSKPKFIATATRCLIGAATALQWFSTEPGEAALNLLLRWIDALVREDVVYLQGCVKDKTPPSGAARIGSLCDALAPCVAVVAAWRAQLMVQSVHAVLARARTWKRDRGLISFTDMIGLLHEKLTGPEAGSGAAEAEREAAEAEPEAAEAGAAALAARTRLIQALRKRYRFALVDEFQDTDPVQWEILQTLFVNDPDEHNGRLIIIGDPKQSIYRFRGADVATYLRARQVLTGGAPTGALDVNWRSTPQLIAALNKLFGGVPASGAVPSWFPPAHGIRFEPVRWPEAQQRRFVVTDDQTERGALTLVRPDEGSAPERQWQWARWIAHEIRRLTQPAGAGLWIRDSGSAKPRRVVAGDIAILIKARRMGQVVQRALGELGIPNSTYKQGGLFTSDEALHLLYVLQAIEQPGDRACVCKALLTRFFGYAPGALTEFAGFAPGHRVPALLARWAGWAENRRWSRLFGSLLEETGVLDRDLAAADGDRRVTNLQQLAEYLCAAAYGRKLSLAGVIRTLQTASGRVDDIDDPADKQRLETEASKVRIMTIHVSKGLEFPIVFLFDPPGKPTLRDPWLKYHEDGRQVYDLLKDPMHKADDALEAAQENLRLCYVAMTRAMFKLYMPGPELGEDDADVQQEQMAPDIATPGARLLTVFPADEVDANVQWLRAAELPALKNQPSAAVIPATVSPTGATPPSAGAMRLEPAPRPDPHLFERKVLIESFTRLRTTTAPVAPAGGAAGADDSHSNVEASSAAGNAGAGRSVYGERDARDYDEDALREWPLSSTGAAAGEESAPAGDGSAGGGGGALGGREFGTLLHNILEAVDFKLVGQAADSTRLGPAVMMQIDAACRQASGGIPPSAETRAEIARLIWAALNTPLPVGGAPLRLAELSAGDRIHELEFQFRLQALPGVPQVGREAGGGGGGGGGGVGEAHIHGYIDLVFRHRDANGDLRYYLLDWKSNRLAGGYAPEALQESMAEENYELQQQLYTVAVVKWLRARLPGFDYARQFGGAVYLYLRGLTGAADSAGVCLPQRLSAAALQELEQRLSVQLAGGHAAVDGGGGVQ